MKIEKKKKLVMNKDGSLSYPHTFEVGMLIEVNLKWRRQHLDINYGIVTEIRQDQVIIYWQTTMKFETYSIANAVFKFVPVKAPAS